MGWIQGKRTIESRRFIGIVTEPKGTERNGPKRNKIAPDTPKLAVPTCRPDPQQDQLFMPGANVSSDGGYISKYRLEDYA